jgi:uncharacterized PurR-regulated membrane protein YhhQ (DUF165 family)
VSPPREGVAWACVAVLVLAAGYEALVALEVIGIGAGPGEGAPGAGVVLAAALLAYAVGAVNALRPAFERTLARRLVWVALAPAGVAFLVARWFSFDPYFAQGLRRYSEGWIAGSWIAAVCVGGAVAALLAALRHRLGAGATSVSLLLSGLTAWLLQGGK